MLLGTERHVRSTAPGRMPEHHPQQLPVTPGVDPGFGVEVAGFHLQVTDSRFGDQCLANLQGEVRKLDRLG
ncbi:hypothetical protein D3C76_1444720 [compost metagenome]